MKRFLLLPITALVLGSLLTSCGNKEKNGNHQVQSGPVQETVLPDYFSFAVTNLDTEKYPDNPDLGYMASDYRFNYFDSAQLHHQDTSMSLVFTSASGESISLENVDLKEFIPTVPAHIKSDAYLTQLLLINQEWNRNQVRFDKGMFKASKAEVVRVDLARNCLNAYLWELIVYVDENGKELPYAHGWFNFPKELYQQAFESINGLSFAEYAPHLEHWKDVSSEAVPSEVLRKVLEEVPSSIIDLSDAMYPLKKARLKKYREIIEPSAFSAMRDLQSDSTVFATFSPPGFYNRADPRTTELGRIYQLNAVEVYKVLSPVAKDTLYELNFSFTDTEGVRQTQLCLGGMDFEEFPTLSAEEANQGWKNSMGFANHTFYESYKEHLECPTAKNPYYAYLSDAEGKWLDSHKIGIDGPIIHWDDTRKGVLHVWLLSFERHALVGHYEITFQ